MAERRISKKIKLKNTFIGGDAPVLVQSMLNVPSTNIEGSVEQAKELAAAGCQVIRFAIPDEAALDLIEPIKNAVDVPLVADIHFDYRLALECVAAGIDKVRINPGNYVDAARTFKKLEYTDEEYAQEIQKIHDRFVPFLNICKENHTAIRIGVNHGSLSDRIMSRYGDTPEGMVESCMEFLRICVAEHFTDVVISIKASNTVVMVKTVRLLVAVMEQEGMSFPLHLGVTEAGDGEDGRIKSALGIGALLCDGLGDTIRVSLSEAPEAEIPVARKLVDYVLLRQDHPYIPGMEAPEFNYLSP